MLQRLIEDPHPYHDRFSWWSRFSLYYWLLESEERIYNLADDSVPSYAAAKAEEYYRRFVTLGIDLELHDPVQLVEDSDDGMEDEDDEVDDEQA